jgi:hypothetical protein
MEAIKQTPAPLTLVPATPTLDAMVEQYTEDQERERTARVNVFAECIKDGAVMVSTESQASEIARLMNRAAGDLEDAKAIAAGIIRRAEQRVESLDFIFSTPLEIWTSARIAGQKRRSIILDGGQLSLRKVPQSTKTVDPEALLAWCQKHLPAAVELVPKVKSDVVKAHEEKSGLIADGRQVTPEHDSFKVSVPK